MSYINHSFDEVDAVIMANEDCDPLLESNDVPEEYEMTPDESQEVDNQVSDVFYDDVKDDSTTIEDMAAQEFRAMEDSGFETSREIDMDVVDIVADDEDDEAVDDLDCPDDCEGNCAECNCCGD